jgi:hypothetical protein
MKFVMTGQEKGDLYIDRGDCRFDYTSIYISKCTPSLAR